MQSINSYILEKFKISKDIKISKEITRFLVIYSENGKDKYCVYTNYKNAMYCAKENYFLDGYCFTDEEWEEALKLLKTNNQRFLNKSDDDFFKYIKKNNILRLLDYESKYIVEKFKISKDINTSSTDTSIKDKDDEITKDFRKLYKMISKEFGSEFCALDSLVSMSDFNDTYDEFYYSFNDEKWTIFLRDIVNYDIISLNPNGSININNSNHKDIAKMIKKWNKLPIGKKVYDSFR